MNNKKRGKINSKNEVCILWVNAPEIRLIPLSLILLAHLFRKCIAGQINYLWHHRGTWNLCQLTVWLCQLWPPYFWSPLIITEVQLVWKRIWAPRRKNNITGRRLYSRNFQFDHKSLTLFFQLYFRHFDFSHEILTIISKLQLEKIILS